MFTNVTHTDTATDTVVMGLEYGKPFEAEDIWQKPNIHVRNKIHRQDPLVLDNFLSLYVLGFSFKAVMTRKTFSPQNVFIY